MAPLASRPRVARLGGGNHASVATTDEDSEGKLRTTMTPATSPPGARIPHYLFVGERPSPLAASRAWTWEDGRVCARTLHAALADAGIDRATYRFANLWATPGLGRTDEPPDLAPVIEAGVMGTIVVALGRLVQRELERASVPHRSLIHPAARGAIRRRDAYRAHVRAVLQGRDAAIRPLMAPPPTIRRRTDAMTARGALGDHTSGMCVSENDEDGGEGAMRDERSSPSSPATCGETSVDAVKGDVDGGGDTEHS